MRGRGFIRRCRQWLAVCLCGWLAAGAVSAASVDEPLPPKMLSLEVEMSSARGSVFYAFLGETRPFGDISPYHFNAILRVAEGGFSLPCNDTGFELAACAASSVGDLYFGVILPNGTIYTWAGDANEASLREGLTPIASNLDLRQELLFDLNATVGDVQHVFTRDDPAGMYSVFALLVRAGANPTQENSWYEADMRPLIVRPWPIID
jgi:hypothetical protein